ncbi:uncharacterized protein [Triticum aestivum]|uniref:uncharacterized protein n=1 Tax=Triticum aestivum TaxID=4565 RepID=UPI001D027C79|nr:uncharacterized protein LOC123136545 [Triticum aestivum]
MEAGFSHGGGASSSSCWGKNGAWSKLRDEPYLARKDKSIMLIANVTAAPSIWTSFFLEGGSPPASASDRCMRHPFGRYAYTRYEWESEKAHTQDHHEQQAEAMAKTV